MFLNGYCHGSYCHKMEWKFLLLDLQKSCKECRELRYAFHPASPNVNIGHNHGIFIKINKLLWVIYY